MKYHNLFDKWTETSAYILGFWMADGCIFLKKNHKVYYKMFELTNTDKQIMHTMSQAIVAKCRNKLPRQPHHLMSYEIRVHSDKLFDFCYSIVRSVHKSHTSFQLPIVPRNLFHHFVRGFFDGDGSICHKHYKNRHGKLISALTTSFTGGNDTDHIEQLRDWLRDNIGLGDKKVVGRVSKKLTYNQYDSLLLCEFMYKDATICMKRKKDIWDAADKAKLRNSTKYFSNKV